MAHVKLHHSLSRAHKILRAVNALGVSPAAAKLFSAESWDNCREQGLCLQAYIMERSQGKHNLRSMRIFIAEARGSDQTVVVVDDGAWGLNNEPSHEAWENAQYFSERRITLAAGYVVSEMEKMAAREVSVAK